MIIKIRYLTAARTAAALARLAALARRAALATDNNVVALAVVRLAVLAGDLAILAVLAGDLAILAVLAGVHSRHFILSTHIFCCQARRIAKSIARSSSKLEPPTKCPSSSEYANSFPESSRPPRARVIHFTGS